MVFLRQILHNNRQRKERMKKFLITTIVGIATTTAFGAASLRAPQMGGTVTVATPTATNTARAGTMRTQTMKTSSVSTPSVTTTQSIATPVSTETTDARIALLKGIKGFNPGKIKDTTTATNELNSLNDRIEELTAQLDRAEAAQSTVLTESNLEAKIEQKLSALGTSTGTKETYSKEEVNELLSEIINKLPQIDERGNINIPASNGKSQIRLLPYYLYATHTHALLGHSMTYKLYTPHDFGIVNWQPLAPEFTSGWISDICAPYQSEPDFLACGYWNASGVGTTMTEFNVARCDKGFYLFYTTNMGGVQTSKYVTYENKTESQIREHFCGNLPNDLCWISNFQTQPSMGNCTPKIFYVNKSDNMPPYYYVTTYQYNGGLQQTNVYNLTQPNPELNGDWWQAGSQYTAEWVSEICSEAAPENLISCRLGSLLWPSTGLEQFHVVQCFEGFYQTSVQHTAQGAKYNYSTYQDLTEAQIRNHFCGDTSSDLCWISGYHVISNFPSCNEKSFTVNITYPTVPESSVE